MPFYRVTGVYRKTDQRACVGVRAKAETTAANKVSRDEGITVQKVEPVNVWCFKCRIAGTSHNNRDGSDRQLILKRCKPPEKLLLEHETNNRHDKHAIRLLRSDRSQIGYVPQDVAADIVDGFHVVNGCKTSAVLVNVQPFGTDTDLLTGELIIVVASNTATEVEIQNHLATAPLPVPIKSIPPLSPILNVEIPGERPSKSLANRKPIKRSKQKTGCLLLSVAFICCTIPIALAIGCAAHQSVVASK